METHNRQSKLVAHARTRPEQVERTEPAPGRVAAIDCSRAFQGPVAHKAQTPGRVATIDPPTDTSISSVVLGGIQPSLARRGAPAACPRP
jgi:hypothetical protein